MTRPRRRSLLPGCLLVLLSAFFGLVGVALIVVGSLSGSAVDDEPYRWTDGDLVLDFPRHATCTVVPEAGPRRVVEPVRRREQIEVARWFSGPAEVTCDWPVTVWQGGGASFRSFVSSSAFEYGLATLVVLPLLGSAAVLVRRGS
ncbi:hypothetical protein [Saccharopolyspora thermophila]|uniref:hypothetical protein n=1 Tax=Saccharopolyspora thermophila TaxID=89367 RepID=UPI00166578FA|nr:hypothetical protein [Saccharopolyspora subtropica]